MSPASSLRSHDPRTGRAFGPDIPVTPQDEVDRIAVRAATAGRGWADTSHADRGRALRAIADAVDGQAPMLVQVADGETALGVQRLTGEVARTTAQLRMFAGFVSEHRHLDVIIAQGEPGSAQPDVRRMLFPIGLVAVYAASNFPFAFSTLGGDTASALAAGCPVVVKAHEGHPATTAATAAVARAALRDAGFDQDVLSVVYGFESGKTLIQHAAVRAAGFTGSLAGGRALFDLATRRPDPIPMFGEFGSVNPVIVLPGAAAEDPAGIADGYAQSLTLGSGQFCTNPGLMFVPGHGALMAEIARAVAATAGAPMLTERMSQAYDRDVRDREQAGAGTLATGTAQPGAWSVTPRVQTASLRDFAASRHRLSSEVFGPAGLVIGYPDVDALHAVLSEALPEGSLTATIHGVEADYPAAARLARLLRPRAGRLIFNGWPTGVAVVWPMHHGGPWPATSMAAHTSVGARAVDRWLVPAAFQNWPQALLPAELRDGNPLGVPRLVQPG
jgi:NADP-dependent aldehyde dehydrogenase